MDVNTDVWGLPSSWVDGSSAEQAGEIKYPVVTANTYNKVYSTGLLDLNTMDMSCCYYGIGEGSILNKPHYIAPYQLDGQTELSVQPVAESKSRPLILASGNSPLSNTHIRYTSRWSPAVAAAPANDAYAGHVIMSYNYQKIILVPYVRYKAANATSLSSKSLYDYINDETYTTANQIVGIAYRVHLGAAGSRGSSGTYVVPLITYDMQGYDLTYNSVYFWSQGGCRLLTNGVVFDSNRSVSITDVHAVTTTSINNTVGDSITAMAYKYCKSESTSVHIYYFDPDNTLWQLNKNNADGTKWFEYPYIEVNADNADDVRDYILSQIAYLGLPFVYDPADYDSAIGDAGVYLPVFDKNGITTGEYKTGTDALRLPNSEWTDSREGAEYDPNITPQGDLDNSDLSKTLYYSSNKYYVMNQSQLDTFLNTVNGLYTGGSTPEEKAEEIQNMQVEFKGSNPADYIVGLYGLPLDITRWGVTASVPVVLGPVEIMDSTAAVLGLTMSDILYPVLNFNSIDNIPGFGDFRDYAPYTTLELYVPYCGTVQLDPAIYIGHGVKLEGLLDLQTGEMCVRVLRDGITVTNTITGNIYVSLPITSQAMGTYENSIHQLQMAGFNRAFNNLTGAVTGGVSMGTAAAASGEGGGGGTGGLSPTAPITMAANLISLPITMYDFDYRINHCQPSIAYTSACSPANNVQFYRRAKLYVKRPVMLSSYTTAEGKAAYAHTVGHACSIIGTITSSGISGFCQIGSIDLSGIPATVEEINAIKQALNKGVYV